MSEQMSLFDELFNLAEVKTNAQTSLEKNIEPSYTKTVVQEEVKDMFDNSSPAIASEHNEIKELFKELCSDNDQEEKRFVNVKDVRTEKQKGNKISYDVGKKIWGARKDLEEIKRLFLEKPNHELLNEIADLDKVEADKLATKANVFSWFSMEDCRERGVEFHAAYGMYLMIRRIPANSKGLNRSEYMKALVFISDCFKDVKKFDELVDTLTRFSVMVKGEREFHYRMRQLEKIQQEIESLPNNEEDRTYLMNLVERTYEAAGMIRVIEDVKPEYCLHNLGAFSELLASSQKQKTFNTSINKYSSWDDYFKANERTASQKGEGKGGKKQSVWERKLPIEPKRIGGREIEEIHTPEHFREYFGFLGIQFGHYLKDIDARAHLINSSRAYVDLADILGIEPQLLSLSNELSMAFGARGKGKALAHYERSYKIINLTKEKGSLGVLSHEWFHAFDHYLNRMIAGVEENLFTEGKDIYHAPLHVYEAWHRLMEAIKEGQSTAYFDVRGCNRTYRVRAVFMDRYKRLNGDLHAFMDEYLAEYDERVEGFLSGYISASYLEKKKAEYQKKRKKVLRETAEALAQYHKEVTGEEVTSIPYTVNQSQFYRNALVLDREKEGKYWSANQELTARAFEAYIQHKLRERNWRSDYLVCGIDAFAYPVGEELRRISEAMDNFLKVTLPYLK